MQSTDGFRDTRSVDMKRITICVVMIAIIILCASCGGKGKASAKDVEFLTATEYWYAYDEVTGEYEKMRFSEDFSFYWGCECGEPVGDSDLYELYAYDKEGQTIKLYNDYDDSSMEVKVLDHSDYHLLLEVNGEVRDYTSVHSGLEIPESERYLAGYNMYAYFIEGSADSAVLGPFDYDGDIEYPENAMKTYVIADDAEFYEYQITKTLNVDSGESTTKSDYRAIEGDDLEYLLNNGAGFIWFNDKLEITKAVFYGEIEIQE